MGEAFLTRRGGGYAFAQIDVEYPEGSTCTCSNGTRTLAAKTTGGKWIFSIPSAGTWTVTAVDGNKTKSENVSITTKGQIERVTLLHRFILHDYESGESVEWAPYHYASAEIGSDGALNIAPRSRDHSGCVFSQLIDVTYYSKLVMVYKNSIQEGQNYNYNLIGLTQDKTTTAALFPAKVYYNLTASRETIQLDIAALTGSYYVGVMTSEGRASVQVLEIYRMWLE